MHLNMSLRFPGSPQSLPDGTVTKKAELKALIPYTTKIEAGKILPTECTSALLFFCVAVFPLS